MDLCGGNRRRAGRRAGAFAMLLYAAARERERFRRSTPACSCATWRESARTSFVVGTPSFEMARETRVSNIFSSWFTASTVFALASSARATATSRTSWALSRAAARDCFTSASNAPTAFWRTPSAARTNFCSFVVRVVRVVRVPPNPAAKGRSSRAGPPGRT